MVVVFAFPFQFKWFWFLFSFSCSYFFKNLQDFSLTTVFPLLLWYLGYFNLCFNHLLFIIVSILLFHSFEVYQRFYNFKFGIVFLLNTLHRFGYDCFCFGSICVVIYLNAARSGGSRKCIAFTTQSFECARVSTIYITYNNEARAADKEIKLVLWFHRM